MNTEEIIGEVADHVSAHVHEALAARIDAALTAAKAEALEAMTSTVEAEISDCGVKDCERCTWLRVMLKRCARAASLRAGKGADHE